MSAGSFSSATKLREGEDALGRGEAAAARQLFAEVIASGHVPPPWLQLAQANRALGDMSAAEQAVDRLLSTNTRDLRGLIIKGDCLVARGHDREAVAFYQAALRLADDLHGLPANLKPDLDHAAAADRQLRQRFENHIRRELDQAGFPAGRLPALDRSLEILLGREPIEWPAHTRYPQEPTNYFYPGLPLREFYESEFEWAPAVEQACDSIRQELLSVVNDEDAFEPYVVQHPNLPVNHHRLMNDPSWSAFFLIQNGQEVADNIARCPQTMEAVRRSPLAEISKRAPNVLFSLLRPGAHIPPHTGVVNTHLICHLPLIVPPGCAIRVGNSTREWDVGRLLIFDDSIEHEAWNRSDQIRVVLIFEIWRPELELEERRAIATLFSAVEGYGTE